MSLLLEILICLVFVYTLLSAIVSGINELIMYALNQRGKFLKEALGEVFNDKTYGVMWLDQLYSHPGIDLLKKTPKSLPSYISSGAFSKTLIDLLVTKYDRDHSKFVQDPSSKNITMVNPMQNLDPYEKFKAALNSMEYSDIKNLLTSVTGSNNSLLSVQTSLETWYNDYMDRAAGWYKSALQKWLLLIAAFVTLVLNVDTIKILKFLATNDLERQELILAAEKHVETAKYTAHSDTATLNQLIKAIQENKTKAEELSIPIGWNKDNPFERTTIIGWILTTLAISFGSPIWFELLNKLINLRKAGKKPEPTTPNPAINP